MPNIEKREKIYFENLDAIRFLCFLSVFLFHSFHTTDSEVLNSDIHFFFSHILFANGNLGVNFFFVLSGFLITFLLIKEKKLNGQINLKKFWIRRVLRIWPLFYFCVFFGFVLFPFIKTSLGEVSSETANIYYYLSFLNNFDLISNGLPEASTLGVLWSIAIEEQFYLVWPIILYFFNIKKYWIPFGIIFLASLISRFLNPTYLYFEYHTLSCISDMVIGSFGAWLIIEKAKFKKLITNCSKLTIATVYLIFFIIFIFRKPLLLEVEFLNIFERAIIGVVITFIILEQSFSLNSLFKFSKFKLFTKLGLISYGLYSLHFIGILVAIQFFEFVDFPNKFIQTFLLETSFAFFFTILISKISYRILEKPFLKVKERFSFFSK